MTIQYVLRTRTKDYQKPNKPLHRYNVHQPARSSRTASGDPPMQQLSS